MIIAIDFDGTCVKNKYPYVGEDIGAVPILKDLVKRGHRLILCTMRSHKPNKGIDCLQDAVDWFNNNGIELYAINENPEQKSWTDSNKIYADLYIDDAALGCPLTSDGFGNVYVDWSKVSNLLYATR